MRGAARPTCQMFKLSQGSSGNAPTVFIPAEYGAGRPCLRQEVPSSPQDCTMVRPQALFATPPVKDIADSGALYATSNQICVTPRRNATPGSLCAPLGSPEGPVTRSVDARTSMDNTYGAGEADETERIVRRRGSIKNTRGRSYGLRRRGKSARAGLRSRVRDARQMERRSRIKNRKRPTTPKTTTTAARITRMW